MTSPRPTALFIGDSITDADRSSDDARGLGHGYVKRIHETVNTPVPQLAVVNRGVNGNRLSDLASRWRADVLDDPPDILTILVGINDVWRRYDANQPTSARSFAKAYDELVVRARAAGISTIVLLEPFLVPLSDEQVRWHVEDLHDKIAAVHTVGRRRDCPVIALNSPLQDLGRARGLRAVVEDGVHPTPTGHDLIASRWVAWAAGEGLISI